jgi:hypothetical protein
MASGHLFSNLIIRCERSIDIIFIGYTTIILIPLDVARVGLEFAHAPLPPVLISLLFRLFQIETWFRLTPRWSHSGTRRHGQPA